MIVTSDAAAECLHRIGYYRLASYWYPFRQNISHVSPPTKSKIFHAGTEFRFALDLYVFDKKLRLLVLDAIERIEIAVRVDIAHHLGQIDPFIHTKPALLDTRITCPGSNDPETGMPTAPGYIKWQWKYADAQKRANDIAIKEFKDAFTLPLPIWMAVEVWDFGQMSWFYSGMKVPDRQAIATRYGVPNWRTMGNWLRALHMVRNIVAHHGRL